MPFTIDVSRHIGQPALYSAPIPHRLFSRLSENEEFICFLNMQTSKGAVKLWKLLCYGNCFQTKIKSFQLLMQYCCNQTNPFTLNCLTAVNKTCPNLQVLSKLFVLLTSHIFCKGRLSLLPAPVMLCSMRIVFTPVPKHKQRNLRQTAKLCCELLKLGLLITAIDRPSMVVFLQVTSLDPVANIVIKKIGLVFTSC